jgi:hypothetical protein
MRGWVIFEYSHVFRGGGGGGGGDDNPKTALTPQQRQMLF